MAKTTNADGQDIARLSVVIVSYQSDGEIRDCLDSLREHNDIGDRLEIVVVEQSPTDRLYRELCVAYPDITVIRHENKGFGAGNNAGAAASTAEYLLFLNPDTVLVEPVFSFACRMFSEDMALGVFGVRLLDAKGDPALSFHFRDPKGGIAQQVAWKACNKFDVFMPRCMHVQGADMFVRRAAFVGAGGFDENIFMYNEEQDLCNRINHAGYRVAYFPQLHIKHLEGQSSGGKSTRSAFALSMDLDSLAYYCEKYQLDYSAHLRRWRRYDMLLLAVKPHSPARGMFAEEIAAIDRRLDELDA